MLLRDRLSRLTRPSPATQERLLWLLPLVVVFLLLFFSQKRDTDLMGACIGVMIFAALVNRPGVCLLALVIILPLEPIGFSLLLKFHVPASILRPLGAYKELLGLALLFSGIKAIRDTGRHLDRIDFAVLAYVFVVTVYLIVPHLFSQFAPEQLSPRLLAWRSDAGYPLIFFGARHAIFTDRLKERFVTVVMTLGGFAALVGLYQRLAPHAFANFVLNTAHVPTYEANVLGLSPATIQSNLAYIYSTGFLRVGSIFLGPFDMGDFMVVAGAFAAVRISRNRRSVYAYLILAVTLGANFFTRSRSDGLAIAIVIALVALPIARSPVEGRIRLMGSMLLAGLLIIPSLGGTHYVGAQGGSKSDVGHITEIRNGLNIIGHYPLGIGLGAQPGVATRFSSTSYIGLGGDITDNAITQVGDELGLQALIPWLVMMAFIFLELRRRARAGDWTAQATGFALLGIMIAGMYHHVFLEFPVPWTVWAGAGLGCSVAGRRDPKIDPELTTLEPLAAGVR